ncbi:MAG TPA: MFS transporter, partial [Desulfobacteraceae bacterium]|nr:MFS transporter [Desulfobacteraceae bacterium]
FVTMSLGETMWSFGVFFKPLESEFGWSRRLVSSGYTAFLIAYSISSIVAGRMADRYGPRKILMTSGILAGLGISLCSRLTGVNEFRAFLFLAGLGAGATWSVPVSTVQRWFFGRSRAGLALSIVVAGVGVGALIFAPLINYLILNYGWRNAYLLIGVLFFLLITPSSLIIRRSPPDADSAGSPGIESQQDESLDPISPGFLARPAVPDLPVSKVLIHPSYLILIFAACVTVFVFQLLSVHFVPYATDLGHTSSVAAVAVGLMGALSVPGRLLGGAVSDRIGWKKTLTFSLFGITAAALWLLFTRAQWSLYSFGVIYGLFWGIRSTSLFGTLGEFFGVRSLGELVGITSATANILGAFVPYLAGYIFDTVGSYSGIFVTMAVLMLCTSLLTTTLKKPG